jgi:hypothetical protein
MAPFSAGLHILRGFHAKIWAWCLVLVVSFRWYVRPQCLPSCTELRDGVRFQINRIKSLSAATIMGGGRTPAGQNGLHAIQVSESGSLGLRGRHPVWSLSAPPRSLPISEFVETRDMCPQLAGICAVGFGVSVSAGNVGPIWPASLWPQNSRSWGRSPPGCAWEAKWGRLSPVLMHQSGLMRAALVRALSISPVEAVPAVRTDVTILLADRATPPRQCRGAGGPQSRP